MTRSPASPPDLGAYVRAAAGAGELVVQPRMGMAVPSEMAAGLTAVAGLSERTVGTITLDSYTRVGDHSAAVAAVRAGKPLNGFPLVGHGPRTTAKVAAAAGRHTPVQVRHGSADPRAIFRTMAAAGLGTSEGGPVSYCLPYGRTPLAESVAAWREATRFLAEESRANGIRAHLESFGGCLLGQLCPPSLLVAMSVLECLFFAQNGMTSVSLSYAQQTSPQQDVEALAALRLLAEELLPPTVDRHVVLYTYMGVFPRSVAGAGLLLKRSADLAVRGGAERLIVKTETEAHRIPTVAENLTALRAAAAQARRTRRELAEAPREVSGEAGEVLLEARALITAVLSLSDDVGTALLRAFHRGVLDIPYCLHPDNRGAARGTIGDDGRLRWSEVGAMPLLATVGRSGAMTSNRLSLMLRRVAEQHDREAAREAPEPVAAPAAPTPLRIGLIGGGPRGLSILERLVARCAERPPARPVEVTAVDPYCIGAGRIWRPEQSPWFLMNTPAREVTMFSGPSDGGPARPGAGPTLAEWWAVADPENADPEGYAPRVVYGRYLRFVLGLVLDARVPGLTIRPVKARALTTDRGPAGDGTGEPVHRVRLDRGDVITVDRLVLASGHPTNELDEQQREWLNFAEEHPPLRYVVGDSAAEMPLDAVPPGATVGVLGMGLTFYDVVSALTLGRGGRFLPAEGGGLRYLPSGREPRIVPASRSGIPLLTRGRNQKTAEFRYRARLFTPERMAAMRAAGPLDFQSQVLPWLLAEMNIVLLGTRLRHAVGPDAEREFGELAAAVHREEPPSPAALAVLAEGFGPAGEPLDALWRLARPFAGRRFASPAEYRQELADWLREDLADAVLGNYEGPVKAASDVLRDVRATIRSVVDFGGLTPDSHRRFLADFNPVAAVISTGPPAQRSEQFLALLAAGVVEPVGPAARFRADRDLGCFTVESGQVEDSRVRLDALVDARVPSTDLRSDRDPLIRGLLADGVIRTFVNSWAGGAFDTGGLATTDTPFHPVRADGGIERTMFVLGIPSEHTRWFTQVGSGRPGPWGAFTRDADAIAEALLTEAAPRARQTAAEPAGALAGRAAR
ncbi:FAD/NAD(P)-binding protein [Streptomyces sp. NRRL B-24484]|uniref:FAD/NAD(P)-binding protein n=1 Tax=Streptomyces sp. NRRL B-24484 TaxID=1463833 RepID=UPI000693E7A7|nr:FAD/NAD(P)-binding protein [Streptomyces sp. NRRL B-24484]